VCLHFPSLPFLVLLVGRRFGLRLCWLRCPLLAVLDRVCGFRERIRRLGIRGSVVWL
jgi:hypothetical protein